MCKGLLPKNIRKIEAISKQIIIETKSPPHKVRSVLVVHAYIVSPTVIAAVITKAIVTIEPIYDLINYFHFHIKQPHLHKQLTLHKQSKQ